jgi:hypothetical protein
MVQEDRTCYQLAEILCQTNYTVIHHHPNSKFPNIIEQPELSDEEHYDFTNKGINNLFNRLMKNYLKWKGGLFNVKKHMAGTSESNAEGESGLIFIKIPTVIQY